MTENLKDDTILAVPGHSRPDKLFPLLVGLSVVLAFLADLAVPPVRVVPFPLLALLFAVPIGTLRLRRRHIAWLGVRYAAASCISVLGAYLPFVFIVGLAPWQSWNPFYFPESANLLSLGVFIALDGGLCAWLAMSMQGSFDEASAAFARTRPGWDPRSWGVTGKVGGAIAFAGLAGWAWSRMALDAYTCHWGACGPTSSFIWMNQFEMGLVAFVGTCVAIAGLYLRKDDRAFPVLTGLGVSLVIPGVLLVGLGAIPAWLLAIPIAVPIGSGRVRGGEIAWSGPRVTAVCFLSVVAAWLPFLVVGGPLTPAMKGTFPDTFSWRDGTAVFVLLAFQTGFSAWIAALLQPWADGRPSASSGRSSPWNPAKWGVAGKVGGTLYLMGLGGCGWVAVISARLRWIGPLDWDAALAGGVAGVLIIVGLAGLLLELLECWRK